MINEGWQKIRNSDAVSTSSIAFGLVVGFLVRGIGFINVASWLWKYFCTCLSRVGYRETKDAQIFLGSLFQLSLVLFLYGERYVGLLVHYLQSMRQDDFSSNFMLQTINWVYVHLGLFL